MPSTLHLLDPTHPTLEARMLLSKHQRFRLNIGMYGFGADPPIEAKASPMGLTRLHRKPPEGFYNGSMWLPGRIPGHNQSPSPT